GSGSSRAQSRDDHAQGIPSIVEGRRRAVRAWLRCQGADVVQDFSPARRGDRMSRLLVLLALLAVAAPARGQTPNGATLFDNNCATCHTMSDPRVPSVESLGQRTPESIVDALTKGAMIEQGGALSVAERRAVA